MSTVQSVKRRLVPGTNVPTPVLIVQPVAAGNFQVSLYYVMAVATTVTATCSWVDESGSQQAAIAGGSQAAGAVTAEPIFCTATPDGPIQVTITADQPVEVSAAVQAL